VVEFHFDIPSKGGGTTAIILEVGSEDIGVILESLATEMPEHAAMLARAATTALNGLAEKLREQREEIEHMEEYQKTVAKEALEDLLPVEDFVSDKYESAPSGGDLREAEVLQRVQNAVKLLSQLG